MTTIRPFVFFARLIACLALSAIGLSFGFAGAFAEDGYEPGGEPAHHDTTLMWLNHEALVPGDSSVQTSFNYTQYGGSLLANSTTLGDCGSGGGGKVVIMGVQAPPHFDIVGVRVCYLLSNPRSYISQIRLAQWQDPPAFAYVLLDDPTDLVNPGPVCADSWPTAIDPQAGATELHLKLNYGDTSDTIQVRGVALRLKESTRE